MQTALLHLISQIMQFSTFHRYSRNMVLQKFNLIYGKLLRAAEKGQDLPMQSPLTISRRPQCWRSQAVSRTKSRYTGQTHSVRKTTPGVPEKFYRYFVIRSIVPPLNTNFVSSNSTSRFCQCEWKPMPCILTKHDQQYNRGERLSKWWKK